MADFTEPAMVVVLPQAIMIEEFDAGGATLSRPNRCPTGDSCTLRCGASSWVT
jgi:hypothetical protein